MEPRGPLDNLLRILAEERRRPTVRYEVDLTRFQDQLDGSGALLASTVSIAAWQSHLYKRREKHPRDVCEQPQTFKLSSVNFDLLMRLAEAVLQPKQAGFFSVMLRSVSAGGQTETAMGLNPFQVFGGRVSDTPLIAEFCVRSGKFRELLAAAAEVPTPTPGLALMLMQLEDIIALNFNVFTEDELREIPGLLAPIGAMASRQTHDASRPRGGRGPLTVNPHYRPGAEREAGQIVRLVHGISRQCDQAVYFYVKGGLQQIRNPEVEGDKVELVGFLERIGFPPELRASLEESEKLYRSDSSAFELKSCLGHLRSFLEALHRKAAAALAAGTGDPESVDTWGAALNYIRRYGLFDTPHERFAAALYTLISDESVHPLTADREYARLLRTVIIEYGLMFLTALEKNGVKIARVGSAS